MKNRYEGYCYVCGELVEQEKGVAEQVHKSFLSPSAPGYGDYRWCVRHTGCERPTKPFSQQSNNQTKS